MNKHKKNKAFTLAEVLITLGIIGVVAAMTIPTLMNKTNDLEMKSAWKKAFSELSQAQQQLINDNGGVDFSGQCDDWDDKCLRDLFATKIKTIKTCNNAVSEGCSTTDSKYLDSSLSGYSININDGWPGFITQSGYSVKFRYHTKNCDLSYPYECGWMQVDVNGLKKPNIAGKDIFFIDIPKTKLVPFGSQGDTINLTTDCAPSGTGMGCSAKYLTE